MGPKGNFSKKRLTGQSQHDSWTCIACGTCNDDSTVVEDYCRGCAGDRDTYAAELRPQPNRYDEIVKKIDNRLEDDSLVFHELSNSFGYETFNCPYCADDGLEYGDLFCMECNSTINMAFWAQVRDRYDKNNITDFLGLIACNELTLCCIDHMNMCVCDKGPLLFDTAEELVKEVGLDEDNIWDESCQHCVHRNSSQCAPYLDWLTTFCKSDKNFLPEKLLRCGNFELIDGHYTPAELEAYN